MGASVPKLTKRVCDAAKATGKQYVLWDDDLPRFGLRVRESGSRVFIAQYRHHGRTRVVTLGSFGPVTPDQARREALRVLGEVERGSDPALRRDRRREEISVRELGERWLAEHVRPKSKASTAAETERLLAKVIYPALGRRRCGDTTRADVSRFHASLAETPITANRSLSLLHALFAFGERIGARAEGTNPARGVERYPEESRRRFLSDAELARLGAVMLEAEATGTEAPETVAAIRLLLFTGCRKGEILGARWRDLDEERGLLRLPDTKTGAREVPLNPAARAVFDALPRASEWIIPGREHGAPLVNLGKPWRRIRAAAGIEDVRLHDLRHSHASAGVAANVSLQVIGGLLGHRQPRTTARYAHLSDDPLRKASDAIGARLSAALDAKPDAPVVPLTSAPKRHTPKGA